jgi:NAD(P)H-flavin reductase
MRAKETICRVLEHIWISPTVMRIRFEPLKEFGFKAGQFVSVMVPPTVQNPYTIKRCYSLASSPLELKKMGYYELCVRYVPGGAGSGFISTLRNGDTFQLMAPYGHFLYKVPDHGRAVCFICTSTGIAPFRSIIFSKEFREHPPRRALCLLGARNENELLYKGELETHNVETKYAVSQPGEGYSGFKGRVTDLLKAMDKSPNWKWHGTDYYLCGNGDMVTDVVNYLHKHCGVPDGRIRREAFSNLSQNPFQTPVKPAGGEKKKAA